MQKENIPTEVFNECVLFASTVLCDTSENGKSLSCLCSEKIKRQQVIPTGTPEI